MNIQQQPDPLQTVMETALFLRESDEIDNQQWHKFSRRFFAEYRETIMRYYGYENQLHDAPLRKLHNPRFFIAIMAALLKLEIIGCNTAELSKTLYEMFRFEKELSTVRRWFYEMPPEYEDILTEFMKSFRSLKIKK